MTKQIAVNHLARHKRRSAWRTQEGGEKKRIWKWKIAKSQAGAVRLLPARQYSPDFRVEVPFLSKAPKVRRVSWTACKGGVREMAEKLMTDGKVKIQSKDQKPTRKFGAPSGEARGKRGPLNKSRPRTVRRT